MLRPSSPRSLCVGLLWHHVRLVCSGERWRRTQPQSGRGQLIYLCTLGLMGIIFSTTISKGLIDLCMYVCTYVCIPFTHGRSLGMRQTRNPVDSDINHFRAGLQSAWRTLTSTSQASTQPSTTPLTTNNM